MAAAGDYVVVVGGHTDAHVNLSSDLADGAVLDSNKGAWHAMAAAPQPVGAESPAVWDGTELIVLTANGTVLGNDPIGNRWRSIGTPLDRPRIYASIVWTGKEVLVGNGLDPSSQDGSGNPYRKIDGERAFSPSTGRWRALPTSGVDGASLWTGSEWLRFTAGVERNRRLARRRRGRTTPHRTRGATCRRSRAT